MSTKKHIVHVFDGFRVGGTEVRTTQILNAIGQAYRHTIVSLNGNFDARSLLDTSLECDFLHPPLIKEQQLKNIVRSRSLLASLKPNLLITYGWSPIEWVMGNGILPLCPSLQAEEGFTDEEMFAQIPRRALLRRIFFRTCGRVVVCSKNLESIAKGTWKLPAHKIVHIHNGIDVARFDTPSDSAAQPCAETVTLGIVASLLGVKNHLMLLEAFRRISHKVKAHLLIIGEGVERQSLQSFIDAHNLQESVKMVGHQSDPAPFIKDLDIFCLASRSEQMPLSVLEAMAASKPIVSTDVGDVAYMVSEHNRPFVVAPNDIDAYSEALEKLCKDGALRRRIGQSNRQKCCDHFTHTKMFENYRTLYDTMLQPRRNLRQKP